MIVKLYEKYNHLTPQIETALRKVGPIGRRAIRDYMAGDLNRNMMCAIRKCGKCEASDVCHSGDGNIDKYWVKEMLRNIAYPKIRISCDRALTQSEQSRLMHGDLEELSVELVKTVGWLEEERVRIKEAGRTKLIKGGGEVIRRRKADRQDRRIRVAKWEVNNEDQETGEMNFSLPVKAEDTHGTGRRVNTNTRRGYSYDNAKGYKDRDYVG